MSEPEIKQLMPYQRGLIEAVAYTLKYGLEKGWTSPMASLDSCIEVLKKAKKTSADDAAVVVKGE